ncbi:MAG: TetR/AcrR family transcriptional regulator [Pseudomonadota bacterium]
MSDPQANEVDGRKARSERSRQQIIDALFRLVRSGEVNPSAARVAEQANVSLRTVFRHFEEIDSLYREMVNQCEAHFLPTFMAPFASTDWQERLMELRDRRMKFFEDVLYLRICTEARRYQSDVLMADYKRFFKIERARLESLLPDDIRQDINLMSALDVALCFDTYRRLRQESGMTPEETRAAVASLLDMILAQVDA